MNNEEKILSMLEQLSSDVSSIKDGQAQANERLDRIDERLDQMDERLDRMDERFDRMEEDIADLKDSQRILETKLDKGLRKLDYLAKGVSNIRYELNRGVWEDIRMLDERTEEMKKPVFSKQRS